MKTIKIYIFSLVLIISSLTFADMKNVRYRHIPNSTVGFNKYITGAMSAEIYADQLFIRMNPERFNLVIEDLKEKFKELESTMPELVANKRMQLEEALTKQALKYNDRVHEHNSDLYKTGFAVGAIIGLVGGRLFMGGPITKSHASGAKLVTYDPIYPNDIKVSKQIYDKYAANPQLYTDDENVLRLFFISGVSLTSGAMGSAAFYLASKTDAGLSLLGRVEIDLEKINNINNLIE